MSERPGAIEFPILACYLKRSCGALSGKTSLVVAQVRFMIMMGRISRSG